MQTGHNQRDLGREREERGEFVPYRPVGGGSSGVIGKGTGTAGSRRREPWQREPSHHGEEAAGDRAAGTAGERGHRTGRHRAGAGGSSPPPSCSTGWVPGPAAPRELSQSHAGTAGVWGLVRARQPAQERLSHGLQPRCGSAHPPSLADRQHPRAEGTGMGIAAPCSPPGPRGRALRPLCPPRGAGPQTSSPRSRRGFPCPVPHLQASWGRQQWDLWGYSGPQIRARSSPARFPSCPFRRERSTAAGGRDSPGPSPPSSPFPLQTPPSPGRGAIPLIQAQSPKPAGAGG